MSKLVVRFSKKGRDVRHLDFIGYLAMLETVTIKGKEFPVVPATKGMNKGQVADKRVVFWKLYEKLYRLQIQNDGIRRQAYQNGYKYVPVTVTKKQLAMYVAGYATEKPIDRMISQMIEMGLISREIKGQKGKGGSMYIIREPLENLLSQLPDEALKQMGFKAGELQTVQGKCDNYLIDKEKEHEEVDNPQHEEVKPQSDQEVSPSLDDQEIEEETGPSVEVNDETEPSHLSPMGFTEQPCCDSHTQAAKVTPCWGAGANSEPQPQAMPVWDNWTPDDDEEEEDEPYAAATPDPEPKPTDWDALLAESGVPLGEPEPAKEAAKVTTEWDDNVPF